MEKDRSELEMELLRRARMQEERIFYEEYKNRQRRKWLAYALALAPIPLFLVLYLDLSETFRLASYVFTGSLFAAGLFMYLQPSKVSRYISSPSGDDFKDQLVFIGRKNRELEKQNRDLNKKIEQIISQLQSGEGGDKLFSEEDKLEIRNRIQAKLESEELECG